MAKSKPLLNHQHELFCQLYAKDKECIGNGTKAYAGAYNKDVGIGMSGEDYATCSVNASKLLRKTNIQDRIIKIRNEALTNDFVDAELFELIRQSEEKSPKLGAIKEFNKLQKRIVDTPVQINFGGARDDYK